MDRIAQGRSATLSQTIYVDGTATNPAPDSATVTITRADGTALVTSQAATDGGVGIFTYTLTPAQTTLLDTLTVAWTFTYGGQSQAITSYVEVAGGFLFTIAQARTVKPLDNTTLYTVAKIAEARTLAEQALEDACGVAFVPRYRRETVDGNGRDTLLLKPRPRSIRSLTVGGTAVTGTDLTAIVVKPTGELYRAAGWTLGNGNVVIGYEHGHDLPPLRVGRACLLLAKLFLVDGPFDDRATSISTEDGTFSLVTPGLRGSAFGIPEVDAVVQRYDLNVGVA